MTVVNILIAAVALGLMGLLFGLLLMGTEKVLPFRRMKSVTLCARRFRVRTAVPAAIPAATAVRMRLLAAKRP